MKILVTVASKHDATREMAEWIGEAMWRTGVDAVIVPPDDVTSLDGVDAVVLGSGVYAGRWLRPATKLVERLKDGLQERPVYLFSSGPLGDPPKPETDPVDVASIMAATRAVEHRVFPGRLQRKGLGFAERAIVSALRAPEGDFRPRSAVEAWANEIVERARSGEPAPH